MKSLLFALLANNNLYGSVEYFAPPEIPPKNYPHDVVVYYLIDPSTVASKFKLPPTESAAATFFSSTTEGKAIQQQILEATKPLGRFFEMGLTKVPAVVVDGTYVIYGVQDVEKALTYYRSYCATHDCNSK